jgi:pyrroline-5-carboxylate reductase
MCDKLAFIGTGKMAQAMLRPLIANGYQPEDKIAIYDVSTSVIKEVQQEFKNIQVCQSIADLVTDADLIVCAVKPQNINPSFWEQFPSPDEIRNDATMISILAGTTVKEFEPSGISKIVRAMPNTPATIGQGMTVWCCTPNLSSEERDSVKNILDQFGKSVYVDDEKFVDMSTSISGSGPAYVFMLMEAMIDAGVHMGFSRDVASKLCHHTLLGSTLYAMETGEHPAILRNMVTSPAGTTASAIYELENGKFRVVIKDVSQKPEFFSCEYITLFLCISC